MWLADESCLFALPRMSRKCNLICATKIHLDFRNSIGKFILGVWLFSHHLGPRKFFFFSDTLLALYAGDFDIATDCIVSAQPQGI